MQTTPMGSDSGLGTPDDSSQQTPSEEPQKPARERSGMLGEPAGIPPGRAGSSDGSERGEPIHEQVPNDGKDHWRR